MQLYNIATQTEIGFDLPKLLNETHQTETGGGRCSGVLTNEVSKSFPDNSDGRGNGMPL